VNVDGEGAIVDGIVDKIADRESAISATAMNEPRVGVSLAGVHERFGVTMKHFAVQDLGPEEVVRVERIEVGHRVR
jgi:hypothetical protein